MQKNIVFFCSIFFLALALRLPFIERPPVIAFDEGINSRFADYIVHKEKYFDVHPPLAHIIFSVGAGASSYKRDVGIKPGESFGSFPFARIRLINAVAGSLLPAVIFLLGLLFFEKRKYALFPALLVTFDNALVIYSRFILPDIWLVLFGFSGLLFVLISTQYHARLHQFLYLVLGGVFLGAALSVKWTGLGFFAMASMWYLGKQKQNAVFSIVTLGITILLVYVSVFMVLFSQLKNNPKNPLSFFPTRYLERLSLQDKPLLPFVFSTFPMHTFNMFVANQGFPVTRFAGSEPYQLPFNRSILLFWQENGARIVLMGNVIGWALGFFAIFAATALVVLPLIFRAVPPALRLTEEAEMLIAFFFVAYAPLFFLGRFMLVYHYFTPAIISYFLIPIIIPLFVRIWTRSEAALKRIEKLFIALLIASFIVQSPLTYGFLPWHIIFASLI